MTDQNDEIVVIGWHDAITEAVLRVASGKWMYASMIAWSQEKNLRIYGLVEADDAAAAEVQALCAQCESSRRSKEESWSALRSRIAAFLRQASGPVEIRLCEDLNGETKATMQVGALEILPLMGREIEETLDSELFERLSARFHKDG